VLGHELRGPQGIARVDARVVGAGQVAEALVAEHGHVVGGDRGRGHIGFVRKPDGQAIGRRGGDNARQRELEAELGVGVEEPGGGEGGRAAAGDRDRRAARPTARARRLAEILKQIGCVCSRPGARPGEGADVLIGDDYFCRQE
jgi:hypothetical protein